MALVRTEALLLKAFRFGETSMIYRLFTRERGVVPVIAKGARRPRSRLGAAVAPFRRLEVTYYDKPGREIQTLSQVEVLVEHRGVTGSLERLETAGEWFRFLRAVLPDGAPMSPLYSLAATALDRLESIPPEGLRRWEAYHRAATAELLGLAPRLDTCIGCGTALPVGEAPWFSIEEGGVCCKDCAPAAPGARPLDSRTYALLSLYHHPDWSLLAELTEWTAEERSVQDLIHRFVAYHADVRPPSATAPRS